jgi:hypothetical protein
MHAPPEHSAGAQAERARPDRSGLTAASAPSLVLALQGSAGNRAVAHALASGPLLQRYTRDTVSNPHRWVSDNGLYQLREDANGDCRSLHVGAGADAPRRCRSAGGNQAAQYRLYVPSTDLFQDCLHTAEEIMADRSFENASGGPDWSERSIAVSSRRPVGRSHEVNVDLALDQRSVATGNTGGRRRSLRLAGPVNEAVAPDVGQAFFIVNLAGTGRYPYHAAAVVAKDGDDRITLEVAAGSVNASARQADIGEFRIYSVSQQGNSFHDRWNGLFTDSVTIAIEPSRRG